MDRFDWMEQVDADTALRRQEVLMELVEERQLVVKTAVLERVIDEWPSVTLRRAHVAHSGVIWLSESGPVLSRVRPSTGTLDGKPLSDREIGGG
jgi:hypothetical protein